MDTTIFTPDYRTCLVLAFGKYSCRAAREIRRCPNTRWMALVAVRPRSGGNRQVFAKPFDRPAWRCRSPGPLAPELLKRLSTAAASIRDRRAIVDEFGSALASVVLDVLVLADEADPAAMADCQALLDRVAPLEVLQDSCTPGLRILTLIGGSEPRAETADPAHAGPRVLSAAGTLANHVICIHTSNVDRFTLSPGGLAALVGRSLGCLVGSVSEEPIRAMLSRPGSEGGAERRYWSLGFATLSCRGAELIRDIRAWHRQWLRQVWLEPHRGTAWHQAVAKRLLHRLVDNASLPLAGLPRLLARCASRFFAGRPGPSARRATPCDLYGCLREMVSESANRRRQLAADLPNFRRSLPVPRDPRGWLKRVFNRLSWGRLFRWEAPRPVAGPSAAESIALRRARLAALDGILFHAQLAVGQTLASLRQTPAGGAPHRADAWPGTRLAEIVEKLEILQAEADAARDDAVAKALLAGREALPVVQDHLIRPLDIPAGGGGLPAVAAIASLLGHSANGLLRRVIRGAAEQAAPWWSGPVATSAEEQVFVCLPQGLLSSAASPVELQSNVVPWDQEAIGVFRFLRGCLPAWARPAMPVGKSQALQPATPSRTWVSRASMPA